MATDRHAVVYEKYLSCPVCMELLTDPRALPCMHTFCVQCLHSHITSVCTSRIQRGFDCPVCRANTKPPLRGLHPNSWAENFPLNFPLKGIIDELVRSDVSRGKSGAEHTGITDIATDEDKPVCHARGLINSDRQMECVYKSEDTGGNSGSSTKRTDSEQERCSSPQTSRDTHIGNEERKPDSGVQYPLELPTVSETQQPAQGQMAPATRHHVENTHRKVIRLCNSSARDTESDKKITSLVQSKDDKTQENARTSTGDTETPQADTGLASTSGTETPVRMRGRKSRVRGNAADKRNSYMGPAGTSDHDVPRRSRRIWSSSDGRLSRNINELSGEMEEMVVVNVDTDVIKTQLQFIGEYCIKSQHDRKCCSISGLSVMPDGRVLLADANNCNLKLFDERGVFVSYVSLTAEPWDVTSVEDFEAAVTCPSEKSIYFALVDDTVALTSKSITLDKKCYGIAYSNNELFVAMESEIRVLKYNGDTVRRIVNEPQKRKIFSLSMQKTLFRGAKHVCYDGSGLVGLLHASDCEKSCITTFDRKGGLMSKMRLGEGGSPLGMSLGEKGQLFLCQAPNQLLTISIGEHGNRIRPLVSIDNILTVDYNRTSKQLWVTRKLNNNVKVYTVKT